MVLLPEDGGQPPKHVADGTVILYILAVLKLNICGTLVITSEFLQSPCKVKIYFWGKRIK